MSSKPYRLNSGGRLVDRTKKIRFSFDGKPMTGFAGDTVASAVLASGQRVLVIDLDCQGNTTRYLLGDEDGGFKIIMGNFNGERLAIAVAQGDEGARRMLRGRDDVVLVEVGDVAAEAVNAVLDHVDPGDPPR